MDQSLAERVVGFTTFNGSKTIDIAKEGSVGVDYAEAFIKKQKDAPFFCKLMAI